MRFVILSICFHLFKSFSTQGSSTAVKKGNDLIVYQFFGKKKKEKKPQSQNPSFVGIFTLDCLHSKVKFSCSSELPVATLSTFLSTCCTWVCEDILLWVATLFLCPMQISHNERSAYGMLGTVCCKNWFCDYLIPNKSRWFIYILLGFIFIFSMD